MSYSTALAHLEFRGSDSKTLSYTTLSAAIHSRDRGAPTQQLHFHNIKPESQTSLVSQMDGPCNSGLGRPGVLPQHPLRISSRVQRLGSDLEALWLLQGKGL